MLPSTTKQRGWPRPEEVLAETVPLAAVATNPRYWNLRTANQWRQPGGGLGDTFTYRGVVFNPARNFRVLRTGSPRSGIYPMRENVIPGRTEFVVREADSNLVLGRLPVSAGGWSSVQFGFSLHWAEDQYPMFLVDDARYIIQIVLPAVDAEPLTAGWQMGLWQPAHPGVNLDHTDIVTVECQDAVALLDTPMGQSYSIQAGTNIGAALQQLLRTQGGIGLRSALPAIAYEAANTPSWTATEDLSWLEVANEILEASAHTGLFTDREGRLTALPWRPVGEFQPEWLFDGTDPLNWIAAATELEPESDVVPNHWLGVVDNPDSTLHNRTAEAENDSPSSPWSIPSQGGRRITRILRVDAPSLEALTQAVRYAAERDTLRTLRLRVECGPLPHLWASPVVRVHFPELGVINRLGVCREWQLPLDAARRNAYYLIDAG